ncbi:hypothetical protein HELRODRAFT_162856 [Helobdella robusta]|uniref:Apple domain-containing protein n=1 Tax=Helobdella robusta TaxID=6412 RepID=T1ETA4_HELRO|nr:hypothetical protein HELRODRAFT_162856 [Helobdella robusta]ESN99333.1 hypothetical protein HELRODRAFT_162856 [Helobdella robusta]
MNYNKELLQQNDEYAECWTKTDEHKIIGLSKVSINTTEECLTYCIESKDCKAVDFDTKTVPPCWVQTDTRLNVAKSYLHKAKTVTDYYINRQCIHKLKIHDCWSVTNMHHYPDLEKVTFLEIESCLKYCWEQSKCFVVDFDENTEPPCWVQNISFDIRKSAIKPHPTATNYILDKNCKLPKIKLTKSAISSFPVDQINGLVEY